MAEKMAASSLGGPSSFTKAPSMAMSFAPAFQQTAVPKRAVAKRPPAADKTSVGGPKGVYVYFKVLAKALSDMED